MKKTPLKVLRIGTAITFFGVGVFIIKDPEAWLGYIKPWALAISPFSPKTAVLLAGVFDILVSFLLFFNYAGRLAAFFASLHLIVVLLVSGVNPVTVRDIAILAGTAALFLSYSRH